MDELKNVLMGRLALPTSTSKVPPKVDRWDTANKMIEGYQNGWYPNPTITRLLGDK